MAEQEALVPIGSLISHILTFLVSFVFVSPSIITSGIYYFYCLISFSFFNP